jgi:GAF domain-containing protein
LARKGAKSRRCITGLRSKTTKARTHVDRLRAANADLKKKLAEALKQQTASAEVLQVISSSPGELDRVFASILANATRICEANFANLALVQGGEFRMVAMHGAPRAFEDLRLRRDPKIPMGGITPLGRLFETKRIIHIADVTAEEPFASSAVAKLAGARTLVGVPVFKDNELIGAISIYRQEVRPFTDEQIALVQNFANQAVIAIENTRLLNELRESLQQQTATADVLKVISRSTFDLQVVLDTLVRSVARVCQADSAFIWKLENHGLQLAAMSEVDTHFAKFAREHSPPLDRRTAAGRAVLEMRTVHIPDTHQDSEYQWHDEERKRQRSGQYRTLLGVPLLREGAPFGAFTLMRAAAHPFTDKQIELVTTFADQAGIAIENTRLLNELRDSLQQQTATADVLKVISRSATDVQPVFETIARSAVDLCGATYGIVFRYDGELITMVAHHNLDQAALDAVDQIWPRPPDNRTVMGRTILARDVVHVHDVESEPSLTFAAAHRGALGIRTYLGVPMLRDGDPIGAIALYRREVALFSERQIELVKAFADQSVIAIENTRLLNELRESLQQQTATADMLKVISRSTFDLEVVLKTLVESAAQLCDAYDSAIWRPDSDRLLLVAHHGPIPAKTLPLSRRTVAGRTVLDGRAFHIADLQAEDAEFPESSENARGWGFRAILCVPLMREGVAIGTIALRRSEAQLFTGRQVALLQTFADQAVIAIENARLFEEVNARTEELSESLQQQTATAEVLKVISRSTFDLQTVLDTLVESAARLCEAPMVSIVRLKDTVYRHAASYGLPPEVHAQMLTFQLERGPGSVAGRVALEGKPVQILDVQTEPDYNVAAMRKAGAHTILGVPLLREGIPIGVLLLMRRMVRPFTDKQIDLVTTFADQAVIAIENVRLFEEIQDKNRQLQQASENKSQFVSAISHELRTPLNAIIGLTEMMVSNAARFGTEKAQEPLQRVNRAGTHLLGLINQVLDLSKIEAGKLELNPQTVRLAPLINEVIDTAGQLVEQNKNRLVVDAQENLRRIDRGPHAAAADPAQPVEQCLQVHQRGRGHAAGTEGGRRTRLDRTCRGRHRDRHDSGAAGKTLRGVQPGR